MFKGIGNDIFLRMKRAVLTAIAQVIATHTFWVLFLKWNLRRYVLIATMVFNWAAIGTFVIAGPATVNVKQNGPFCELTRC